MQTENPRILMRFAVFGQKNHGKTTFADALVKELNNLIFFSGDFQLLKSVEENMRYCRTSLMTPTKSVLCALFNVAPHELERLKNQNDYIPPKWNVNMRTALEKVGTTIREIYEEYFIDACCNITRNIIVDDGRLEREIDAFDNAGFNTCLIYRPDKVNRNPTNKYESEMLKYYEQIERGEFDIISRRFCGLVYNGDSKEDLLRMAKETAKIHFPVIKEGLLKNEN